MPFIRTHIRPSLDSFAISYLLTRPPKQQVLRSISTLPSPTNLTMGLIVGVTSAGIRQAAAYHENRKQQKALRDTNGQSEVPVVGSTSQQPYPPTDSPPSYAELDTGLAGRATSGAHAMDKKGAAYDSDSDSEYDGSDDEDETDWQADGALNRLSNDRTYN